MSVRCSLAVAARLTQMKKKNACGPAGVSVNINCAPCLPAVGVMLLNNCHLFVAALLD